MRKDRKVWFIGLLVFIVIAIGGWYIWNVSRHVSIINGPSSSENMKPTTKNVMISGKATCLTPKNTSSPQPTSCAIGLKTEDGKDYALSGSKPTLTGSLQTGQSITVIGTMSQQNSQFNIAGTIKVESIHVL